MSKPIVVIWLKGVNLIQENTRFLRITFHIRNLFGNVSPQTAVLLRITVKGETWNIVINGCVKSETSLPKLSSERLFSDACSPRERHLQSICSTLARLASRTSVAREPCKCPGKPFSEGVKCR